MGWPRNRLRGFSFLSRWSWRLPCMLLDACLGQLAPFRNVARRCDLAPRLPGGVEVLGSKVDLAPAPTLVDVVQGLHAGLGAVVHVGCDVAKDVGLQGAFGREVMQK